MATARIYQQPKSAMSSGKALTHRWVLEFEPTAAQIADPLTGWAGAGDTRQQLRLRFPTAEAAKAYAEREGIEAQVIPAPTRKLKLQAYADNFR
ncbi:ETC complex I subunit [Sphingomonas sp. Y38-1Y]|uniref:ETC complex I subunit n=1 Tax=Sphingomonas sp. Y38-1Y TaxID=3078265 RepID=UPI0028EA55F8|nr:ETC complex I subunit [Sphingomonas sp. Y38-1Y]